VICLAHGIYMRYLSLILPLLLLLVTPCLATEIPQSKIPDDETPGEKFERDYRRIWGGAITECVQTVRQEIKGSDFDAYLKDVTTIAIFGSPRERFAFEKCMHSKGHPAGSKWYESQQAEEGHGSTQSSK